MDKTKVAIIGLGTVGQGVAKLLLGPRRPHRAARGPHAVAREGGRQRFEESARLRFAEGRADGQS